MTKKLLIFCTQTDTWTDTDGHTGQFQYRSSPEKNHFMGVK